MLHAKKARKFGRTKSIRNALLKGLAVSLIKNGKIQTTEAKAKELRMFIEPLVTKAKVGGIAERRLISSRLDNNLTEVKKLVDVIAPKYKEVKGGCTRIIKLPARVSDSAKLAVIEII